MSPYGISNERSLKCFEARTTDLFKIIGRNLGASGGYHDRNKYPATLLIFRIQVAAARAAIPYLSVFGCFNTGTIISWSHATSFEVSSVGVMNVSYPIK